MANPAKSSFLAWQEEKKIFEEEKLKNPELFIRAPIIDDADTLEKIGIHTEIFGIRPLGHIKLHPEDFIVEEVTRDGMLHTIDDGPLYASSEKKPLPEQKTIWCDAIKMGIDTIEVIEEISRALDIEKKSIGFAGIKDKHALTAQSLSLRNTSLEKLAAIAAPHFFIKNISFGKGALQIGGLEGNHFTIFIRTQEKMSETILQEKIHDIEEQGFWNFFYLQRFGAPRLISHKLGLSILQGNYEEAVRGDIAVSGSREVKYFQEIRKRLYELWGNWSEMLKIIDMFPYSFREEIKMLIFLEKNPSDFIGALNQVPEQVRLWVYAYSSFCFNEILSQLIKNEADIPFTLPVILSSSPQARELYEPFLTSHNIRYPFYSLNPFPYVQRPAKETDTLRQVKIYNSAITDEGVILDFLLGKGSYATTFLAHIFELSSGLPLPENISTKETDTKKIIGTGTITPLREHRFKELFGMRENRENNDEVLQEKE